LIYVSVDSSAMRFDKRMNNVNEQVFIKEKSSASAFIIEELNDFLKQHNANEIVIIGLMAEGSLYKSLIEGKDLGYDMYTIPEAIIGKTQKSKDKAVKKLAKEGVKILAINTIINQKTGSVF
jgi:nicotinamidase-related amidase